MDQSTRLQYLAAMGVDVWVPRHPMPYSVGLTSVDLGVDSALVTNAEHTKATEERFVDSDAWLNLQREVEQCQACGLCQTRTQTVFGVGNRQSPWLFIGEAPGQHEDLQGEPFVGKAGLLLNEMMRAIGLNRQDVYIANVLKCRPPNNRDPHVEEVRACHGFLQKQIELIQPRLIVAVGRIAAQNLLQTTQSLSRLRRIVHDYHGIPLVTVPHPAFLLRSPLEKVQAWSDLKFAHATFARI